MSTKLDEIKSQISSLASKLDHNKHLLNSTVIDNRKLVTSLNDEEILETSRKMTIS